MHGKHLRMGRKLTNHDRYQRGGHGADCRFFLAFRFCFCEISGRRERLTFLFIRTLKGDFIAIFLRRGKAKQQNNFNVCTYIYHQKTKIHNEHRKRNFMCTHHCLFHCKNWLLFSILPFVFGLCTFVWKLVNHAAKYTHVHTYVRT